MPDKNPAAVELGRLGGKTRTNRKAEAIRDELREVVEDLEAQVEAREARKGVPHGER